jgi:leucyl aminopeptidase
VLRIVQASWTAQTPSQTDADTVAVGVFDGEQPPEGAPAALGELLASGEARTAFKSLALAHADGKRWLIVGLGARQDLTPERARVAGALARERAKEISTRSLCWQAPSSGDGAPDEAAVAALVEGTVLADYSFDKFKSSGTSGSDGSGNGASGSGASGNGAQAGVQDKPKHLERLTVAGRGDLQQTVAQALVVAEAANAARDLQNRPANDLTPSALAEYARSLGEQIDRLTVETEGREGILARSMGSFAAVAQGSYEEPALITMRYEGPGASEPTLGFVGKAVTFDSGGISLKPGAKMAEMKFDMSGGAAVIEAVAAIARLRLPVRLVAVVGATENLPSGRSVKPGDIVTASNGKTIEVNNTDAEGRLVLADCLCHAISQGAQQVIDLATLTGAVIIALGSTHAGLMSNDDALAARVSEAGERAGEIVWRLPLHEEYSELVKGTYGDLDNAPEGRKAGTIVGATFLSSFVGETPWAHLDIAGSAWDLGRPYAAKGAAGYGVRLLVELARSYADEAATA